MENYNYKKGSRPNPYTQSEYTEKSQNQQWSGGWVKNLDDLIYYSENHSTYSGQCTQSYPVPENFFYDMLSNEIWTGGWVSTSQFGTRFYDTYGTEYDSTYGSMSNPYSLSVYDDLMLSLSWDGGWIREFDGLLRYVQSIQINMNTGGSGLGCGIGNGSEIGGGSGSGILEPSTCPILEGRIKGGILSIPDEVAIGDLYIEWTNGNTRIGNLSAITISIISRKSCYTFEIISSYVAWENAYEAVSHGTFRIIKNHSIDMGTYSFDWRFVVPAKYRV